MTRELKLALIVGFSLVLVVWVLITDHVQKSHSSEVLSPIAANDLGLKTVGNETPNRLIPDQPLIETEHKPKIEAALPQPLPGGDGTGPTIISPFNPVPQPGQPNGQTPGQPNGPTNPGQTTPDANGLKPTTIPDKNYAVQSGDTLYSICKKTYNDASLHTKLAEYNKLAGNKPLKLDQKLVLPAKDVLQGKALPYVKPITPAATPTAPAANPANKPLMNDLLNGTPREAAVVTTSYKIASGDTLSSISRKLKVSLTKLYELNPGLKNRADNLIVGETLDLKLPKQ